MTRAQVIQANDELRQHFTGGRVEFVHGPYSLDDRTVGRVLCALAKYTKFEPDSLHDRGCLIFAGFACAFQIEFENGERVLRVWISADVLQGA